MPDPQFAVRTEEYKWIDGVKQDWVYHLSTDPTESTNVQVVPKSLTDAKETYRSIVENHVKWQTTSPRKRQISDEECKRLMALGYTTCMQ